MKADDLITTVPELQSLLANADHVDVKKISGPVSLREFLAGMLSYNPGWIKFLYAVRWGFVRLLGMKQSGIPQEIGVRPEEVAMTPGAKASFFTVKAASEDHYWAAGITEAHLTAHLAVVARPQAAGNHFEVVTIVHYHKWTGPLYFNVIRPFHHLVVKKMAQAGVRASRDAGIQRVGVV
jgi:hypothetical protein